MNREKYLMKSRLLLIAFIFAGVFFDCITETNALAADKNTGGFHDRLVVANHSGRTDADASQKGDINGDGKIDLMDAITALQIAVGFDPVQPIYKTADVNADSRIGIAEVVYILEEATGLSEYGEAVKITLDIGYSDDGLDKHRLDIYAPENAGGAKVLFFVPGGAWRQGDKDQYGEMATTLASYYGFVVVAINYRLSNDEDGAAVHPDHTEDVALAFQWVMKNISTYQGDPSAVFLFGQSAGAHLVSLLATDEQYLKAVGYGVSNIRGVISMSGVYELADFVKYPANPLNLSINDILMYKGIIFNAFGSWDESVIGPASPAHHVNSVQPPFLIMHTEYDMPGFVDDGEHFYSAIHALGEPFAEIHGLKKSDYSAETWNTATELAAAEPMLADYIGHYAEVVAINEKDRDKVPTTWIVDFVNRQ